MNAIYFTSVDVALKKIQALQERRQKYLVNTVHLLDLMPSIIVTENSIIREYPEVSLTPEQQTFLEYIDKQLNDAADEYRKAVERHQK